MCDLVKTKINELGNFFLSKVKKKVAVWWQFGGSLVAACMFKSVLCKKQFKMAVGCSLVAVSLYKQLFKNNSDHFWSKQTFNTMFDQKTI